MNCGESDMDDDSDDSSQSETLDQFRKKWHKELNTTKRNPTSSAHSTGCQNDDDGKTKNRQVKTHCSPFNCRLFSI